MSGLKHVSRQEGRIRRGRKETFGGDAYAHCLDCGHSLIGVYKCQNIILYTLDRCSLLYKNCISIILLKMK